MSQVTVDRAPGAPCPLPPPQTGLGGAERASIRERMQRSAAARPFIAYMAVVAVLAGFYYGVIATPLYVSETQFSVRSKEVDTPTTFLTGLLGQPSGLSDIVAIQDYIGSHDILNELQKRFDLRRQYSQPRIDPFQWFPKNSSRENFQAYFNRHVTVKLDREASTVIVDVKAFDPQSAKQTADAVLELTEQFVNGMSQRLRDESLTSAKAELDLSVRQAEKARQDIEGFRGSQSDLDPGQTGSYLVSSLGSLQSSAVSTQNQLAALKTYSRPDAPAVQQLQAQLVNINAQIAATKAGQSSGSNKPHQVTNFETLQLARGQAETVLATAKTNYEVARASAEQREKYIVRIVTPNLPQKPTSPKRILEFVTIIIFAMAGYALVALTAAAIRDHRGV